MSDTVIRVENLGKRYSLGCSKEREKYTALRDVIANSAREFVSRLKDSKAGEKRTNSEAFWALKNIDFNIRQGDRVGIIGRNGAGKSTLLKILSRITEPTEGRISIKGRVASLLEVGTGFHPELTGRENIYLNGAILGMSKVEINQKFDEIVAFSEVEKFLDTPVKRYSSGMYVRLAFSVAAHLEPEILIVDEVLAVGDAHFQKKCLGKMESAGKDGRTVIFVSHNIAAVKTLCETGLFLRQGNLLSEGAIEKVVDDYVNDESESIQEAKVELSQPDGSMIWMRSATLLCNGSASTQFSTGDAVSLRISYQSTHAVKEPKIGFVVYSGDGQALLNANNHYQQNVYSSTSSALEGTITCELGQIPLVEGRYSVSLWLGDSIKNHHYVERALMFEVMDVDIWGTAKVPPKISPLWWPTQFSVRPLEKVYT